MNAEFNEKFDKRTIACNMSSISCYIKKAYSLC